MKKYDIKDYQKQQKLYKPKIEYAYGILMEKGDRLIDDDYEEGYLTIKKQISYLQKQRNYLWLYYQIDIKLYSMDEKDLYINFKKEDISDLYWLTASMAGSIQSSRGANPYELINIPIIGKLLETAIALDPKWGWFTTSSYDELFIY